MAYLLGPLAPSNEEDPIVEVPVVDEFTPGPSSRYHLPPQSELAEGEGERAGERQHRRAGRTLRRSVRGRAGDDAKAVSG